MKAHAIDLPGVTLAVAESIVLISIADFFPGNVAVDLQLGGAAAGIVVSEWRGLDARGHRSLQIVDRGASCAI